MNALGLALERATKTAHNHESLEAAFEVEWEKLQRHPEAQSHVVSVPRWAAEAWSRGRLSQLDLLLTTKQDASAIFWASLPRLSEFYPGLEACRDLFERGAQLLVMSTDHPVVLQHCQKWGCRISIHEGSYTRLAADRPVLEKWIGRFCHRHTPEPA